MDKTNGNESNEDVILLPWYSPIKDCNQDLNSPSPVKDCNQDVILLPWYPSDENQDPHSKKDMSPPPPPPPPLCSSSKCTYVEGSSSANPHSTLISHFVGMGFTEDIVKQVIEDNGETNTDLLLESLLTYKVLDKSPTEDKHSPCDMNSTESEKDLYDDLSDADSCLESEEDVQDLPDKERKLLHLIDMGFPVEEASSAIDAAGSETSIMDLMDLIYAAQIAKTDDDALEEAAQLKFDDDEVAPVDYHGCPTVKRRKKLCNVEERSQGDVESWQRQRKVSRGKAVRASADDDLTFNLPKNMIGFGVPSHPRPMFQRKLLDSAVGPPFFYYENVACTPKGVWETISRFLYEIEPEFVDSWHFCASRRKRGYVHNLPVENRHCLSPIPPLTIQDALPSSKKWWPLWDKRTKLNCLGTSIASRKVTQKIRDALEQWDGVPPLETQKYVLQECRKWNLIWTGKNKVAQLEPDELETILGYPKDHTRGGGINRTERYRALGNSFQVDTVAYHLSVLKRLFPNGINVLSLFSGIGGAEVALHRLGIPLKNVVSVEIAEVNRNIVRSWWEQTNQKGMLFELEDVQELGPDKLLHLIHLVGGFDLIIGGSPCNNLSGNNRYHRDGLNGAHSVLFYDYFRILDNVKCIMSNKI